MRRMSALDAYLKDNGISNAAFAKKVGASEATISRLRSGKQTPSFPLVARIAAETDGSVTPNDFLPPNPADAQAAA